jgi:hypothetical protein
MINIENRLTDAEAIMAINPASEFGLSDDGVLVWMNDDIPQPTQAEIDAELTRLQAEYDSQQYARDRVEAYPSLTDQADMAYWDRQDGTTTLDDAIAAVKAEFPKG